MNEETKRKILEKAKEQNVMFNEYQSLEQGAKILINGAYGATGTPAFGFYDRDFAECITKQGKNAILYAEKCINNYFMNEWVHDTGLHRAMGIEVHGEVKGEVSVYIDTDSLAGDSLVALSDDVIAVETKHGIKVYRMDDKVKICRNGVEMEVSASEMEDDDMLIVE